MRRRKHTISFSVHYSNKTAVVCLQESTPVYKRACVRLGPARRALPGRGLSELLRTPVAYCAPTIVPTSPRPSNFVTITFL